MSTATWVPFDCSKAVSLSSRPFSWIASSVPVWSMTCAVSGGTGRTPCAKANAGTQARTQKTQNSRERRKRDFIEFSSFATFARFRVLCVRLLFLRIEVDRRRLADLRFVFHREARLGFVVEDHRRDVAREAAREHVVLLHRLDVAVARDRDAVFRPFELHAQIAERLVGLQRRIG